MTSAETWHIHRDRTRCDKPECPLPNAEEYFALLELPECRRRDLCAMCFHQHQAARPALGEPALGGQALGGRVSGGPAGELIYWRARRKPSGASGPVLDLASLRVLFDRLGEVEGDQAAGLRYFVALLLLRKRILKMVDPVGEHQERADLVVADPKRPELPAMALFAPEIDVDRLGGLKDELLAAIDETDSAETAE